MNDEKLLAQLLEAALDDTKNLQAQRAALAAALRGAVGTLEAIRALSAKEGRSGYTVLASHEMTSARAALASVGGGK